MSVDYVTVAQLREYMPEVGDPQEGSLKSLCSRVSRLIDTYLGVEVGYYGSAYADAEEGETPPEPEASEIIVYGDGSDRLRVPLHMAASIESVEMPAGYSPQEITDYIDAGSYLRRTVNGRILPPDGRPVPVSYFYPEGSSVPLELTEPHGWTQSAAGWPYGVPVKVTAVWGLDAVPGDINEAARQIGVRMFRGRKENFTGIVGKTAQDAPVFAREIPQAAKIILDARKAQQPVAIA